MAESRRARRLWLAAGWLMLAVVLWGTLTPEPPPLEPPIPQFDKLEHFGAFLILTAWFCAAVRIRRRWLWIAVAFILLGGLIEIIQGWSGFRDAEWLDWAADSAGALFALWLPSLWLNRLHDRWVAGHAPGR